MMSLPKLPCPLLYGQTTLAIVKPDAFDKANEIKDIAVRSGFKILQQREVHLTLEEAGCFYAQHRKETFYISLISFLSSDPIMILVLGHKDAVTKWKQLIGPANPYYARKQKPESLRAVYGTDEVSNALHGSDSWLAADREIHFFFSDAEAMTNEDLHENFPEKHMRLSGPKTASAGPDRDVDAVPTKRTRSSEVKPPIVDLSTPSVDTPSAVTGLDKLDNGADVAKTEDKDRCVVNGQFLLGDVIGSTSYATIFKAVDYKTSNIVAVKVMVDVEELGNEYLLYTAAGKHPGLPSIYWSGVERATAFLAMELLGPTLADILKEKDFLSASETGSIGLQMLKTLQHLHTMGIVHRDLKLGNMAYSLHSPNTVKLFDLGLGSSLKAGLVANASFLGSPLHASTHVHDGLPYLPRDDLISLGYCLVQVCSGTLPWCVKGLSLDEIGAMKKMTTDRELCKKCPDNLQVFMNLVRCLRIGDSPDYTRLSQILKTKKK